MWGGGGVRIVFGLVSMSCRRVFWCLISFFLCVGLCFFYFGVSSLQGGKLSVSKQFRSQLDSLMATLNECSPHYIRCIKANSVKKPDVFMGGMILEQLKYSGVFEAVEIRRSGYPCRKTHSQFRHRYWMLADRSTRTLQLNDNHGNMKKQCSVLIDVFSKSPVGENEVNALGMTSKMKGVKLGKTMVLYKADQQRELEQRRMELVDCTIRMGQKVLRGALGRMLVQSLKMVDERHSNAVTARCLEGTVGHGAVTTLSWMLEVQKRCDRKNILFKGLDVKITKLQDLVHLLKKEQEIIETLHALSQGNPLDNYEQLVQWTQKADALNMSQYSMYQAVLKDAGEKRDAVAVIVNTKKLLVVGLERNDSKWWWWWW